MKRAIIPKRGAFIFADYKAIEPRLAAYFTAQIGFPEFAEQLRAGVDPYTAVAKLVTGKSEITDEERQTWKRMFLSLLYGGGVRTIQEQFDVDYAAAKRMIRTFHDGWPAIGELQDRIAATYRRRGYIRGLDGRHLHAELGGEHKLLNKEIQGSAAGIMKHALVNIHRHMRANPHLETRMVSVIHDEVIGDGPEREVPYWANALPNLMKEGFERVDAVVPILVDIEVATESWADKISYEEWASARQEVAA